MESKKLPVLYFNPHGLRGELDWEGDPIDFEPEFEPFEGCEPYIPAARVRERLAVYRAAEGFIPDSLRWFVAEELEKLIADVEDK